MHALANSTCKKTTTPDKVNSTQPLPWGWWITKIMLITSLRIILITYYSHYLLFYFILRSN